MRNLIATLAVVCCAACSGSHHPDRVYGALTARLGESLAVTRVRSPAAATCCRVLILPEASLDAVHVSASLCTQGDINEALLYATVAVVGTHTAVWTTR